MSECENRLFVAYKPSFISSNAFLSKIKKRYKVKKAGFSGTLDPFARGVLIVAFSQYTKLFRFLKKTPKVYRATLWLGAKSETLDVEGVYEVKKIKRFSENEILKVLNSLKGRIRYYPPKYSAKKIDGKRAYDLARKNRDFEIKKVESEIYDIRFINYAHPFLTFEVSISEGGYVRSVGEMIASALGVEGALSYLERIREGDFVYENEKALNPISYLKLEENFYIKDIEDIIKGKVLKAEDFKIQKDGEYFLRYEDKLTIVKIENFKVTYEINGLKIC